MIEFETTYFDEPNNKWIPKEITNKDFDEVMKGKVLGELKGKVIRAEKPKIIQKENYQPYIEAVAYEKAEKLKIENLEKNIENVE